MQPLPVDAGWREIVEKKIREIGERRRTLYNELCLIGWYQELASINEALAYWGTTDERTPTAAQQVGSI